MRNSNARTLLFGSAVILLWTLGAASCQAQPQAPRPPQAPPCREESMITLPPVRRPLPVFEVLPVVPATPPPYFTPTYDRPTYQIFPGGYQPAYHFGRLLAPQFGGFGGGGMRWGPSG